MFGNTRKRFAVLFSALTITLLLVLILVTVASAGGRILHRVHAGGPDLCEGFGGLKPGCDANFSLTATEFADGSVKGQFTDQFGDGDGGFHAVIDCLSVDGIDAWVSGVITKGNLQDFDLTGWSVAIRVQDNGTSANDPPDKISPSFIDDDPIDCTAQPNVGLFDMPQGQVVVK